MICVKSNFFIYVVAAVLLFNSDAEKISDKMYEKIEGGTACFMRLNATHQTGCTSHRKGSTGVIHIPNNASAIDWLLKHGNAGPYMPVLSPSLFTREILLRLKKHYPEKISGIILTSINMDGNIVRNFTHDAVCPNEMSALEGTCNAADGGWNSYGSGLMLEDFPFPMFMVGNETESKKLTDCFEKFNNFDLINQRFRSLCALELKSFMYAAVDTQTCIRRSRMIKNITPVKFCDPLGDRNIWSTLFPRGDREDNITNNVHSSDEKLIVVAARLDTTSMFDGITPGAINPVSSITTLLATAYILKQIVPDTSKDNVLFLLLNGESYDYIGSQRTVYDMTQGKFPSENNADNKYANITLDDISLFIEISQLSDINKLSIFHMTYNEPEVNKTVSDIVKALSQSKFTTATEYSGTIPPSSLQTFLKAKKNIPGIVLADHGSRYRNKYYNSIYDDHINLNFTFLNVTADNSSAVPKDSIQMHLHNVSHILAESIYQTLMNKQYTGPSYDTTWLIDDLIYCYIISPQCRTFRAATVEKALTVEPLRLYVGVADWANPVTEVTGNVLGILTGKKVNKTKKECIRDPKTPIYRYIWANGDVSGKNTSGDCYQTTVNYTIASSPAFDIDDYDWKSGQYSTWAESTWKDFSVQIFLKPSAQHENVIISIGSAVLILSFILVYIATQKSDILFNKNTNMQSERTQILQ